MIRKFALVTLFCIGIAACSTVDIFANALSGGAGVYASDNDPQLVREAMPFGLKTYEGLLEVAPEHRELLLTTANGFTAYAYLLEKEADIIDLVDFS